MYFLVPTLQCLQFVSSGSEMTRAINIQSRHKKNKREKKERKTYNGRVNTVLDLGESLVHIDPQGLCEVLAVEVLAVGGGKSLDALVGNITPTPEEGCEPHALLSRSGPDGLHLIL